MGAIPVLQATAAGMALSLLLLALAPESALVVSWTAPWFFVMSLLLSGFGVADTHLLFELTPPEQPARTLVLGAVSTGLASGIAPLLAGAVLDMVLPANPGSELRVYRVFFAILALLMAAVLLPTRGLVSSGPPQTRRPS